MKMNDKEFLLAGVLIMLLAAVSFNVGSFTGFTVKRDGAAMAITPITVYLDSDSREVKINIVANGDEGVSKYLYVKDFNGRTVGRVPVCRETTHRCYKGGELIYIFQRTARPGPYHFEVFDYHISEYIGKTVNVRK